MLKVSKPHQFVVVKRKLDDGIWIAAMIDSALEEEKARTVVVKERSGVSFDFFVDLVDQLVKLLLLRRRHL